MSEMNETEEPKANSNDDNRRELTMSNDVVKESTRDAYFASLTEWYNQMSAMTMLTNYMYINYNCQILAQLQVNRSQILQERIRRPRFHFFRRYNDREQWEIVRNYGSTDAVAAPLWKRVIAEMIDATIMLIFKIILLIILFKVFQIDIEMVFGKKHLRGGIFLSVFKLAIDYMRLYSEFIGILLLTKFLMILYDCLWITYNHGATPGKKIMRLRVLYVEAVLSRPRALPIYYVFRIQRETIWVKLYPGESPTLLRSFIRTVAKNLVITLFFPICIILIMLRNNRTSYDIISKTIVVDTGRQLLPRRRRAR